MKQRLLIALLTMLVFGAGFAARMWTESEVAVPPAPVLGGEFVHPTTDKKAPRPAIDRTKLVAEIESVRPQIDAYRARLEQIDAEYEEAFLTILTSDQKKIFDAHAAEDRKKKADRESKAASAPPPGPLSDEDIAKLRQRPFESAFYKIWFSGRLEGATKDYSLDAKQQEALHHLLLSRREKFIALVDSIPPPTFRLTHLINSVQRIADPAQQHPAPGQNSGSGTAPAK
jgi:hypothetical protein